MGVRKIGFCLIFFIHLIHFVSSSPVQKTLPSELVQKIKIEDRGVHGSKIEGGRINHGGASGGKAPGNGENGNNAGSASPNTQGGAAVIPVYAAGAANNNHHHRNQHGAGHCNVNRIKFPILLMIIWVNTLIQLCLLV